MQYFFESVGPKGVIQKVILLSPIDDTLFNLGLGDCDPVTGAIDDQVVSDNGDTAKILSTIFTVAYRYLSDHPDHFLHFRGNTPPRNRLYRMAINQAGEELSTYFVMLGLCDDAWETYLHNRPYEAFLIRKK
jgi:hypothetical protein